jgi:hypothetical protein
VAGLFIGFIVLIAGVAWGIVGAGQSSITSQHDQQR